MKLTFSPMRRDDRLMLCKTGDTLTINGEAFDFSGIPEGATLPRDAVACEWLVSDIERVSGDLHLTLILPHGADASQGALFPVPITVTGDGPIDLPAHSVMEVEPVE
ncbi:hypothetical protein FLO80_13380 [Aquicoccus porphyridii]|uniref:Uncharacterized protein n=1 Tax=Aquicoccus porphyridii TaxID=1852029 RepID=A0A5A9Z7W6_9RHOB|nr:hypothetical protein [Aquicoccus porphyridii]KAA0913273.1 hypothetical protein FLO80_13380 [Aquicoccus porphyridii]RAI52288.1 hypothetical protein DOO74_18680 [Rhodobacteraceae bacterium AsT-22]